MSSRVITYTAQTWGGFLSAEQWAKYMLFVGDLSGMAKANSTATFQELLNNACK